MVYVTQLIYIHEGREDVFNQFETLTIPIIRKYNGKLLLRIKLGADSVVEARMDQPYEIHLVEFASETDFDNFMKDEERKQFLYLKEKSVKAVWVIKGMKL